MTSSRTSKLTIASALLVGLWTAQCRADDDAFCGMACSPSAQAPNSRDEPDRVVNLALLNDPSQMVDYYYSVDAKCSSAGLVEIAIVELPVSGHLSQDTSREQVFFPADNTRSLCNGQLSQAVRLYYDRGTDFGGTDNFTVRVSYPNGSTSTIKYVIAAER